MESNKRSSGSLVGGVLLIIFGLMALASRWLGGFGLLGNLWPLVIVGIGALFFVGMFVGGKSMYGLALPGAIITTIGLLLFVQTLTGYWDSWSYAWTLILTSVGLGFYIGGRYGENEHYRQSGLRILKIGAVLFLIFGAFFEMLHNFMGLSNIVFPSVLILLGLYLVLKRFGVFSGGSRGEKSS